MIILLDSGNSRLKVGWIEQKNGVWIREKNVFTLEDFDPVKFREFLLHQIPKKPFRSLGVNVSGKYKKRIISRELKNHGSQTQWLYPERKTLDLINGYKDPRKLGADRWMSMLGILTHFQKKNPPIVLASFGTATTIDTVGPDKFFLGGIILPGIKIMAQSVVKSTARLPDRILEFSFQENIASFPKNTISSIISGIISAQIGALFKQWLLVRKKYKQTPKIYVTGGSWVEIEQAAIQFLKEFCDIQECNLTYVDRPVLDGLALLVSKKYV